MNQKISIQSMTVCALFTALIAVGAFIRVPLPLWPFTLQFLFANLAVLLLGRRDGTIACAAYVLLGLIGLPIFTKGGGPQYIFEPTFGCILGFVIGGFVAGTFLKHGASKRFLHYLAASALNVLCVYALGMAWFYWVQALYLGQSVTLLGIFMTCFFPTIGADIIKCLLSALLAVRLAPICQSALARS